MSLLVFVVEGVELLWSKEVVTYDARDDGAGVSNLRLQSRRREVSMLAIV